MISVRRVVAFVLPVLLTACGGEKAPPSPAGSTATLGALVSPTVSTDAATYSAGATITVSYDGLPGNPKDWIAIAPAGSDPTNYVAFVFSNGQVTGTATFTAPGAGSYVARVFSNNTFTLIAESASFTVTASAPTISTDHASYASGSTVTVSYSALPGNAQDWIAIAPAGSDPTNYVAFVFTGGQVSGTATFTAPAPGSYVARAFSNNTFTLIAESTAFTVTAAAATISTDRDTYAPGATITVTYSGLPGNMMDWIAIAPAGSANTSYVDFVFTGGQTSGTATFTAPAVGSYVARAFSNNTFTLIVESAPFAVVGPSISTDKPSYGPGGTIIVTYTGLPGNAKDWIAIAPAGSDPTNYVDFVYTGGQVSGTAMFVVPAPGSYVVRAFSNNTFTLIVESTPFSVATPAVVTDHSSYAPGATITVSYAGLPGNAKDWIAIAPAGSDNSSFVDFVFTGGQSSGMATFVVNTSGLYVARAFINNTFSLAAESATFTVCGDTGGTLCFVANLNQAQEVPPTGSTATGSGVFVFDPSTRNLTYQVRETVVGATAAHIHENSGGLNGPVIVPFTLVGQGASGSAVLTQAQADDLLAGNLYTNVHSPTFPGGEIRGQIMKPGQILFVANLTQAQEVPPTGSAATGTGSVVFDPATNNIIYRLQHTVANATAAHIHQQVAGMNGPVIVPFTLVGLGASGTATLTASQATALQSAGCYMNVHSAAFPGGEIRGQLLLPGS